MDAMHPGAGNAPELAALGPELFTAAPFSETQAEETGFSNYSYWRSTWRTFVKSHLVKALLVLVVLVVAFTFIYPAVSHIDPYAVSLASSGWNQPPGPGHPFGTDGVGRDIWARVWFGTRTSFMLAGLVALFQVGSGVILGSIWGFNKRLEPAFYAVYNIMTNIPSTIYMVLIAYIVRPSFFTVVIALLSTGWITEARWFRNRILALREADYNTASRCLMTPMRRLISHNIVPHIMSIIIMDAALTIPATIGGEVFLSFIGLGIPADWVTLGNLVNQSRNAFLIYPFQMLFPTAVLCVITVSFYILGNRFADASDPKNHV
jgi:oligopeptide transport system permease protein